MSDQVTILAVVLTGTLGALLMILNVLTLRRLWTSPVYDTSQRVLQTVLLWLLPGSVFFVRHILADKREPPSDDPTATNDSRGYADSSFIDFGGHHHS